MMTTIILIAAFIGVAALVGGVATMFRDPKGSGLEERLDVLTGAASPKGRDGREDKSLLAEPLDDSPGALEQFVSRFGNLKLFLEQAEVDLSPTRFVIISAGVAALGPAACLVLGAHSALIPVTAIVLGLGPFLYVFFRRRRRFAAFGKQLPEALELIARALRAGHSLGAGFQLVGNEMSAPISREFKRVYDEQNLGVALEDAIEQMTQRVPNLDLRFFATAVILQRQTGGDLAEILDKIGTLVRERFKIWGQIQALTGEGRLSGVVLLGLPPVLFLVMLRLNPNYVMTLFTDPLGKQMLAVAVVLQALGALVIRKIINIKV